MNSLDELESPRVNKTFKCYIFRYLGKGFAHDVTLGNMSNDDNHEWEKAHWNNFLG